MRGRHGSAAVSDFAHLGIVGHIGGRSVHRLLRGLGGVGGGLRILHGHLLHVLGVGGLALFAGLVLAAVLIAFLALLLFVGGAAVLAHVEGFQQIVHRIAELALVVEQALQPVEAAAGAILDERPPQIDELLRGRRRCLAGQPLAHQHRDRILDRRVGAVGDFIELAAVEFVVEHGGQIARHAHHTARSDRLDAGLLHRLEHRARLLAAGDETPVHRGVVARELERDRVGMTAHDRGLLPVELARRLRQPHLAANQSRPLGRKRHLKLGLFRDRAQAAGHRALERLGGRFLGGGFGLGIRRHFEDFPDPIFDGLKYEHSGRHCHLTKLRRIHTFRVDQEQDPFLAANLDGLSVLQPVCRRLYLGPELRHQAGGRHMSRQIGIIGRQQQKIYAFGPLGRDEGDPFVIVSAPNERPFILRCD